LVYYGYRFYSPELGRWVNRDPWLEPSFDMVTVDQEATKKLLWKDTRREYQQYVFVENNPVIFTDPLGLWVYDNNCSNKLSASDRAALDAIVDKAKSRLREFISGKRCLPRDLTMGMARRLLPKLDSVVFSCESVLNPICWVAYGYSFPYTGSIGVCVNKSNVTNWGSTGLHETVHDCGKWGHDTPDNPDDWEAWLTITLTSIP